MGYLPEILIDCGAYQFHLDPTKVMSDKYNGSQYVMKPAPPVTDIVDKRDQDTTPSPALRFRTDLDGTNTPSAQGHDGVRVKKLQFTESDVFQEKFPKKGSREHNEVMLYITINYSYKETFFA